MKTKSTFRASLLLALLTVSNIASAQGTAFTYQGRLGEGGSPAHGTYDFRFVLYDLETGGSAVSGAVTNAATLVSNGLFTVTLDFGAGVFTGPNRWLEIGVRTNGASAFTALSPRQPLLPTPYAMHASNADLLDGMNFTAFAQASHNHSAGEIVSGVLAPARGGTGIDTSATPTGSLLRTSGTGAWSPLAPGANGQVLKISGGQPIWSTDNNSGGTVTSLNTGAGLTGGPITTNGTIAIDTAVVPRLGANNTFSASNVFNGVLVATNANNNFAGTFTGSGGALSNLNASALSGTVPGGAIAGTYSNAVSFNNSGNAFTGSFSGNGLGLSNVNAATIGGLPSAAFWQLTGNNVAPGQFLGSTNNQPLELRVRNQLGLRLLPTRSNDTVNVLGGSIVNYIDPTVMSATVAGGGTPNFFGVPQINSVGSDFASIGGGAGNRIGTNSNSGVISGGFGHMLSDNSFDGTISGGSAHFIGQNAWYATIGGGQGNWILDGSGVATIGGGNYSVIHSNSFSSTISGGYQNMIEPNAFNSAIGGGYTNVIGTDAPASTIAGGTFNLIGAAAGVSAIGGGTGNNINAAYSTIGGGYVNRIQANSGLSVIAGGQENTIEANAGQSSIGGGWLNTIEMGADQSAIAGGNAGRIQAGARESFIGGGFANRIGTSAVASAIGGGLVNTIGSNAAVSFIGGGERNAISNLASYATIGGGRFNAVGGQDSVVAGGAGNIALGIALTIGGGQGHMISNTIFGTVAGGLNNELLEGADRSVIGGGSDNRIGPQGFYHTIAGGKSNAIFTGSGSTIGGGFANRIRTGGDHSFIGGGRLNTNGGFVSLIGGGENNTIGLLADHSIIVGGGDNRITGSQLLEVYATIGGGRGNSVQTNVQYATIPGGLSNSVAGSFGFAAGRNAQANHSGAFVWADSQNAAFSSTASNQFLIRAGGGVGIGLNNPSSALEVAGTVRAGAFEGNGSGLTSLSGGNLAPGSVGTGALGNNAVNSAKIGDNSIVPVDLAIPTFSTTFWKVDGNAGTTAGTHFVGTTDGQPVHFKVGGVHALRFEPDPRGADVPNIIGGFIGNTISTNVGGGGNVIVGGGYVGIPNVIRSNSSGVFIGAGSLNLVGTNANDVVIAGGYGNTVEAYQSFIGGGGGNSIRTVNSGQSVIGGGGGNIITNLGGVGGAATIGGGFQNYNSGWAATIAGGWQNIATGTSDFIGGGTGNSVSNAYSSVVGGTGNTSSGFAATVGGGAANISTGNFAMIPGGSDNVARGDYSFAAGHRARANHHGAFVWADSTDADFDSLANDQFLIRANFTGINRATPLSGAEYFGIRAPVTNQYGGMYIETAGTGLPFYGYASPGSFGYAWTYLDGTDGNKWKLDVSGTKVTVTPAGDVGIGTTAPSQRLHVIGNILASGTITGSSDRNVKENFEAVDARKVLDKVAALPIARWNYKNEKGVPHLGPMAQDFHAAFAVGPDDKHISMVDADGVALAAIQGLNQKVEEQATELRTKDAELRTLKERLTDLENVIAKLATTLK